MKALYYNRVATKEQLKRDNTMIKTTYTVTCFELEEGFFVDVLEENGTIEFYLYRKSNGLKMFMFGMTKEAAPPEKWEEIINNNVEDYFQSYIDEYDY